MPNEFNADKERAILEALKSIGHILAKDGEYLEFARRTDSWLRFLDAHDRAIAAKQYEELVSHFPSWVRDTYPALRTLYEKGGLDAR